MTSVIILETEVQSCMHNLLDTGVWELLFAVLFSWMEGQYLELAED